MPVHAACSVPVWPPVSSLFPNTTTFHSQSYTLVNAAATKNVLAVLLGPAQTPPTETSLSAPHLSRKPPVAPLPLTVATHPSLLSVGQHGSLHHRCQGSETLQFRPGAIPGHRGGGGGVSFYLLLPSQTQNTAEDCLPRKAWASKATRSVPRCTPPLPKEGRPDGTLCLRHITLAARVMWPWRSQRGPWHDRQISVVIPVSSPAPILQAPAAPTLLGRFLFSQSGRVGKSPAQKGGSACCALQLFLPTARDACGP